MAWRKSGVFNMEYCTGQNGGWCGGQQCPSGPVKDGSRCWYAVAEGAEGRANGTYWSVPLVWCITKTPTSKPRLVGSAIPSVPALPPDAGSGLVLKECHCRRVILNTNGVVPHFARNEPRAGMNRPRVAVSAPLRRSHPLLVSEWITPMCNLQWCAAMELLWSPNSTFPPPAQRFKAKECFGCTGAKEKGT